MGMGQNYTTRNWTAGFGPCFHLPGFSFWGYPIFDPQPHPKFGMPSIRFAEGNLSVHPFVSIKPYFVHVHIGETGIYNPKTQQKTKITHPSP